MTIRVPALRERPEEIGPLAWHFLEQFNAETRTRVRSLSPEAVDLLGRYPWPGNVRELRNAVARTVVVCDGDRIPPRDLPADIAGFCPPDSRPIGCEQVVRLGATRDTGALDLRSALVQYETQLIRQAL